MHAWFLSYTVPSNHLHLLGGRFPELLGGPWQASTAAVYMHLCTCVNKNSMVPVDCRCGMAAWHHTWCFCSCAGKGVVLACMMHANDSWCGRCLFDK